MTKMITLVLLALGLLSPPANAQATQTYVEEKQVVDASKEETAQMESANIAQSTEPEQALQSPAVDEPPSGGSQVVQHSSSGKPDCESALKDLLGAQVGFFGVVPWGSLDVNISGHSDFFGFDYEVGGQCSPGEVREFVYEKHAMETADDSDEKQIPP